MSVVVRCVLWLSMAGLLILQGCGSSITVTGVVQKGVFTRLAVKAMPVNRTTGKIDTDQVVEAKTEGSRYTLSLNEPGTYVLEAKGQFIDEITGKKVELDVGLKSLITIDPKVVEIESNVNLMTHLYTQQVLNRISSGVALIQAKEQAQKFLIDGMGFNEGVKFEALNLTDISANTPLSDPNLQLLLFTSATLQQLQPADAIDTWGPLLDALSAESDSEQMHLTLSALGGAGAHSVYLAVQENLGLPALALFENEHPVFLCNLRIPCGWHVLPGPSVSLVVGQALEADGLARVRIQLSGPSNHSVSVRIQSENQGAEVSEDYLPLTQTLIIPSGETEVETQLHFLLDNIDETNEAVAIRLFSESDTHAVANGVRSISIGEGVGESANRLIEHVSISDFCITGFGSGVSLAQGDCVENNANSVLALSPRASLGFRLGMAIDCEDKTNCDPRSRNWGTEFILEAFSGEDNVMVVEESLVFAQYRYQGDALWPENSNGEPVYLQAHIGDDFVGIVEAAKEKGFGLRVRAQLMGYSRVAALDEMSLPQVLPGTVLAGEQALHYEFIAIEESTGGISSKCAEGNHRLRAHYSIDDIHYHEAELCVVLSEDNYSAELVSGSIELGGEAVELAAFHSSFIRPLDSEQPENNVPSELGEPQIIIPSTAEGGALETYIHAEGLPFAFRVSRGLITAQGLLLDYDGIYYLHNQSIKNGPKDIASNDVFYSTLHGDSHTGSFRLINGAIKASLTVPGGEGGKYAYPQGNVDWDAFELDIINGKINSTSLMDITNLKFSLKQNRGCIGVSCGGGTDATHRLEGDVLMNGRGTVLGKLITSSNSIVRWGGHDNGSSAFTRADDLDVGRGVMLSLPGFQFLDVNENGLDAQLNGHIKHGVNSSSPLPLVGLQRYPLGSSDAVEGNYWPTGVTVGPQWYAKNDAGALPDVGDGQSLAGSEIVLNNGSDAPYAFDVNIGAKYVLRNAGVTGVFNISEQGLSTPIGFFGYDMQFDRFAFRLVNNMLDEYSWIDGLLTLPDVHSLSSAAVTENPNAGAAGFDVPFTSLALNCRARFDGGNVTLATSPLPKAYAWNAETDVYHLRFSTEGNGPESQCSSDTQLVTLDQTLNMLALDEPVKAVNVQWRPDGSVASSEALAGQDYILEGGDTFAGFGFRSDKGRLETLTLGGDGSPEVGLYGVVKFDSAGLATYFWQSPSVDIRLRNGSNGAEPSVVTGGGVIDAGDTVENAAFNLADNSFYDVSAKRQWGNSFGFDLPVYYTSGDSATPPTLIGRYQKSDLVVLEAGAGIDFIRPDDSMLSFGLSADIAKVKELPMSLDLGSAGSIERLGSYLQSVGIGGVDLQTLLAPLQYPLDTINRLSGAAIESAMKDQVEALIDQVAGEDVAQLAESLTAINSIPNQLSAVVNADLLQGFSSHQRWASELQAGMAGIHNAMLSVDRETDPSLKMAYLNLVIQNVVNVKNVVLPNFTISNVELSRILVGQSDQTELLLSRSGENIQVLKDTLNRLTGTSGSLTAMLDVDVNACVNGTLTQGQGLHLEPFLAFSSNVTGLMEKLSELNIAPGLSSLAALAPGSLSLFEQGEGRIRSLADGLSINWEEGVSSLQASVCGESSESFQLEVERYLLTNEQGTGVLEQLDGLDARLQQIQLVVSYSGGLVAGNLDYLNVYTGVLESVLGGLVIELVEASSAGGAGESFSATAIINDTNENLLRLTQQQGFPWVINALYAEPDSGDLDFATSAYAPLENIIQQYSATLTSSVESQMQVGLVAGQFTSQQLQRFLTDKIMETAAMQAIASNVQQFTRPYVDELSQLSLRLTDQINGVVKKALTAALPEAADLLNAANGVMPNIPLATGGIDGFARFNNSGMSQIHLDANWQMQAAVSDIEGPSFNAALDVLAFQGGGDDAPCNAGEGDNGFDVNITAFDVEANILGTSTVFDEIGLHFVLSEDDGPTAYLPTGIGGGISLSKPTEYQSFTLYQFNFDASIGASEIYLGVGGLGAFDGASMGLNMFVGRTCNDTNITRIDPASANILPFSGDPFLGLYLRGELTAPFLSGGCALDVSFRGSAGAWVTAEPTVGVGGIIGGGALGTIACLGSVRGQVDTTASFNTNKELFYAGQAFVVGGAGFDCDRGTWTSAGRSRGDDWCGTADVSANVRYQNNKWHADVDTPSGIH